MSTTSRQLQRYLRKVGGNIRNARKRKGLRQTDIVELLGVNYRHYQDIEAGRVNMKLGTLFDLAHLYDVGVGELIGAN